MNPTPPRRPVSRAPYISGSAVAAAILAPLTLLLLAADLPVRYNETTGVIATALTLDSVTDLTVTDTATIPTLSVTNLTATDTADFQAAVSVTSLTASDTVDFTGAVHYNGAGRYRSIWIPAADLTLDGSNPPAVAAEGSNARTTPAAFDAATDELAYHTIALPDAYDLGTVKVRLHWHAAATSGDVVWAVAATAVSAGDAVDAAFGAATTVTATAPGTGGDLAQSTTAAVTIAGTPALADLVHLQIYRDADAGGDTMTGDAKLLGITIQYQDAPTAPAAW